MLIIRPTADLAKRMGLKISPTSASSDTVLGDWYALDIVLERRQYLLCVSENGRLPVVLKAAPYATFPARLIANLPQVLQAIGVPQEKARTEVSKMDTVVLAKTQSRSILGSLNEFRFQLQATAQMNRLRHDPLEMSLLLADTIVLVLPEHTPRSAVLKLFGEPPDVTPKKPFLKLISQT